MFSLVVVVVVVVVEVAEGFVVAVCTQKRHHQLHSVGRRSAEMGGVAMESMNSNDSYSLVGWVDRN